MKISTKQLAIRGFLPMMGSLIVLLAGCAAPVGPLTSQLTGTWQDENGLIMIIDPTGSVTEESLTWGVLIPTDGLLHNTLQTGVAVSVDPYTITVDAASNLTMSGHAAQEVANNVTTEYFISGVGTLVNSNLMNLSLVVQQGANLQTLNFQFARTGGV